MVGNWKGTWCILSVPHHKIHSIIYHIIFLVNIVQYHETGMWYVCHSQVIWVNNGKYTAWSSHRHEWDSGIPLKWINESLSIKGQSPYSIQSNFWRGPCVSESTPLPPFPCTGGGTWIQLLTMANMECTRDIVRFKHATYHMLCMCIYTICVYIYIASKPNAHIFLGCQKIPVFFF